MQLFGSLELLMALLGSSCPLLGPIWSQNGPQNGPKICPKNVNFGVHFGLPFFEVLEFLGCLLGAFLGLLRLSWEASGPQKPQKIAGFLRFLKMQLFGSLELLMALLGSSCPLFGRSGPKMGPKMAPKRGPKSDQKTVSYTHLTLPTIYSV